MAATQACQEATQQLQPSQAAAVPELVPREARYLLLEPVEKLVYGST